MNKITRQTHTIDVTDKKLGRICTQVATLLIGKNKPSYVPNQDFGDIVYIENADKLDIDLKKQEQKKYYRYSGYPGGLKTTDLTDLFKDNPGEVIKRCVFQMLPDNKLRKGRIKRLIIK